MTRDDDGTLPPPPADGPPDAPLGPDDGQVARVPHGEEAWRLIDAVLHDRADAAQRQRLEQLAVEHPAVARLCVRAVHLWYGLQLHTRADRSPEFQIDDPTAGEGAGDALGETMILPAVRAADLGPDVDPDLEVVPAPAPPAGLPRGGPSRWRWGAGAAAAVLVLAGTGVAWWNLSRPARSTVAVNPGPAVTAPDGGSDVRPPVVVPDDGPVAVVTATARAATDGAGQLLPGVKLSRGQSLQLTEGAAELTFTTGAVVVVTAPARVRLVDRNALALDAGSLAAHVPPPAVGFGVVAPGLLVVDRGTNFGVRAGVGTGPARTTAAEAAVFDGAVDVTPHGAAGQATGGPVRVTAGHAVRHDAASANPTAVDTAYAPGEFTRDIARVRLPLKLHGTGAGLTPGSADPQWQIVAWPNDPAWKPRAAIVPFELPTAYPPLPSGGHWVAPTAELGDSPSGNYTYRTTVDLTGFDPATAHITAHVSGDNRVAEIKVNGVGRALRVTTAKVSVQTVDLSWAPWVGGANQVDVIVWNEHLGDEKINPTAMSVEWAGTASPVVQR